MSEVDTGTAAGDGGAGAEVGAAGGAEAYPSLNALQEAHAELLKARREEAGGEWSSAFANQVAAFLERGRLTGVRLGPFADRQVAQSTLDFWRAALARQGWSAVESALAEFDPSQRHLTFGDAMAQLRRQQRLIGVLTVAVVAIAAALGVAVWQMSVAREQTARAEAEMRVARDAQATSVSASEALFNELGQKAATLEARLTAPPEDASGTPAVTEGPSGSGGPGATATAAGGGAGTGMPPVPSTPAAVGSATPAAAASPTASAADQPWLQYDPATIQREIEQIRATQEAIGNVALAQRVTRPPAIDGDLGDWPDGPVVESLYVVHTEAGWDGTADVTARWRLAWDDDALYVGVAVEDDAHVQLQSDTDLFKGDSVEIQLDTGRVDGRPPHLDADTYQCILSPGDFQKIAPGWQCFRGNDRGQMTPVAAESARLAARQAGAGYLLEASVGWRDLKVTAEAGRTFGAAFSVTDTDTPGARAQEVFLSNVSARRWSDPTTWGILRLVSGRSKY